MISWRFWRSQHEFNAHKAHKRAWAFAVVAVLAAALALAGLRLAGPVSAAAGSPPGGSASTLPPAPKAPATSDGSRLRVMTFNIRHGEGLDGRVNLARIAAVIEGRRPDVVFVQEVDRHLIRTGFKDEAAWLAQRLGMNYTFGPNLRLFPGDYGTLILTRLPITTWQNYALPGAGEPRGLLTATLDLGDGRVIEVGGTHLGLSEGARHSQLTAIMEHLAPEGRSAGPSILGGDFNTSSASEFTSIPGWTATWQDAFGAAGQGPAATFGAAGGGHGERIDYIWASTGLAVLDSQVVKTDAYDHWAVVADLALDLAHYPGTPASADVTTTADIAAADAAR